MNEKRKCRMCGEYIPYKVVIDGKARNLAHRFFCLKCSPFKKHNTKPDDPKRAAKRKLPYGQWTDQDKQKHLVATIQRGIDKKSELIRMAGGKCQRCGFCESEVALTFHHREPDKKSFPLGTREIRAKKWEDILEEFAKCDLLCMNCHRILHSRDYARLWNKG